MKINRKISSVCKDKYHTLQGPEEMKKRCLSRV